MKRLAIAILLATALSACATHPIDTAAAPTSPLSRIYARDLLTPGDDKVSLTVARDSGAMGSACMKAIYFDGREVAAIDNGEKVVFYITPGRHILGTGPNPNGKALCQLGSQSRRREIDFMAEQGKPMKYRLAVSVNGEIAIMPTAF